MSTEENQEIVAPTPNPNPALPEYSEMIISAIKELNEKEGSNKTSIANQIEKIYPDLHPGNQTLVSHHLDQMKASGQLTFNKNNYQIADPAAPPVQKRGRGRPPKAKTGSEVPKAKTSATGGSNASGRKRGRPAKVEKGVEKSEGVKRGRGRPPKAKEGEGVGNAAAAAAAPVGA